MGLSSDLCARQKRRSIGYPILLAGFLATIGCFPDDHEAGTDAAGPQGVDTAAGQTHMPVDDSAFLGAIDFVNRLGHSHPLHQIGKLDGDPEEVLGRIRAVVPDRSGGLIVLDELMLEVRRYGPDGGLIARAGRGGSGPGEFRAPADIALDRAGNVHVLDPARGRISVLQSDEREGYRPLRDIRTSVPGYAFCMMDDDYIVVSPEEDAVLHRLSSDGRVLRSFAKPLAFSEGEALDELSEVMRRVLRNMANRGTVLCREDEGNESRPRVLFVHTQLPFIRAFDSNGHPVWRVELSDYRQVQPVATRGGGLTFASDPRTRTAHSAAHAVIIGNNVLAVTLSEGRLALSDDNDYHVRLIAVADGTELARITVPAPLVAVSDSVLYTMKNSPFPQIEAYR